MKTVLSKLLNTVPDTQHVLLPSVLINNTEQSPFVSYPFVFISMIMIQAFHNFCLQCKYNLVVLIHSMIESNDVFKHMRKLGGQSAWNYFLFLILIKYFLKVIFCIIQQFVSTHDTKKFVRTLLSLYFLRKKKRSVFISTVIVSCFCCFLQL